MYDKAPETSFQSRVGVREMPVALFRGRDKVGLSGCGQIGTAADFTPTVRIVESSLHVLVHAMIVFFESIVHQFVGLTKENVTTPPAEILHVPDIRTISPSVLKELPKHVPFGLMIIVDRPQNGALGPDARLWKFHVPARSAGE